MVEINAGNGRTAAIVAAGGVEDVEVRDEVVAAGDEIAVGDYAEGQGGEEEDGAWEVHGGLLDWSWLEVRQ